MAMSLFGKSGKDSDAVGKRDLRKAHRFFEHAEAVAEARNYDYAIECYVSGLRHDPDNIDRHEALREVSLRRKVAGGKPAGLGEKFKSGGPTPLDKMLHAEKLWSKDPLNARHGLNMMKWAVETTEQDPSLDLGEVVYWAGKLVMELVQSKPDKSTYVQLRDYFAAVGAFDQAVEACRNALRMSPNDDKLQHELKDLEAENTMQQGGYSSGEDVEEGGFRKFVRNREKQRALEQEDAISKTASAVDEMIARRRAAYEEAPEDVERLVKLVDALVQKESDEAENEAIKLLQQAQEQTGQYQYKVRIGDIRMKQFGRQMRELRRVAEKGDEQAKQKLQELARKRLAFELQEYQERVKNYPTDMSLRFQLGRRLYQARQHDEAIGAFQQAKQDPKYRAASHEYLGSCYLTKGWNEEAIDTLRQGMEAHPEDSDKLGMNLRYLLMEALERTAREKEDPDLAEEAQQVASQILQTDISFRDIRERMEKIRELRNELQAKA
ncbi:MAG: hypothetical protein ACOCTI_02550 [Phycisphaeraceae bacterium]